MSQRLTNYKYSTDASESAATFHDNPHSLNVHNTVQWNYSRSFDDNNKIYRGSKFPFSH